MNARVGTEGPALHAGRRMTSLLTDALVGARFLSVWLATGVLLLVAKIIAPEALQSTSWSFVLPYMTVLAVAALGQMLVIMHAGIDLSTPGVMFLGGYLIVGVGHHDNSRLWIAILACLGLGVLVGLINGILVGILVEPEPVGLASLCDLIERGKLQIEVDEVFDLGQVAEAHRHAEASHGAGKIVLRVP